MSREIKFKAFDLIEKKMRHVDYMHFYNSDIGLIGDDGWVVCYAQGPDLALYQFTGFYDKHGRNAKNEIYDGATVKADYAAPGGYEHHEGIVKCDNECLSWYIESTNYPGRKLYFERTVRETVEITGHTTDPKTPEGG